MSLFSSTVITTFVALLFCMAAGHKLYSIKKFLQVVAGYQLVPAPLLAIVAVVIPLLELVLVVGLLYPVSRIPAAFCAAGLVFFYGVVMAVNLYRGNAAIDCGCQWGEGSMGLSYWHVVRNAIVVSLVLLAIMPGYGSSAAMALTHYIPATALALVILIFYRCFEGLLANVLHPFYQQRNSPSHRSR